MAIKINGTNTTASPGITGPDTDTGLVYGTDEVQIVTGGTTRATVDSSGRVGIGTSSPAALLHLKSDTPYIRFEDDNDNQDWQIEARSFFGVYDVNNTAFRFAIDGSGKVGIGTISPSSYNGAADNLVIYDSGNAGITIRSGTSSDGAIYFNDTDDANQRGIIRYVHASDALAFHTSAGESLRIDSSGNLGVGRTPVSGANGYVLQLRGNSFQSFLQFSTATQGDTLSDGFVIGSDNTNAYIIQRENAHIAFLTNDTERMRIQSGGGISFNGDTAAANALDDYEEGSWTPTLATGTCTTSDAKYIKIGNLVRVSATLSGFSDRSSFAGLQINNAPFASNGGQNAQAAGVNIHRNLSKAASTSYMSSTGNVEFYAATSGAWSQLAHSDLNSASSTIYFFAQFQIN